MSYRRKKRAVKTTKNLIEKSNKQMWQRVGIRLSMIFATAVMTVVIAWINQVSRERLLLFLLFGALFNVLLLLYLDWNRIEQGILDEKANNYLRLGGVYAICCGLTICAGFLPGYAGPVLLISFIMTLAGTTVMGITVGSYCAVLLCAAGAESMWMLSCYLLLCCCGAVVAFHGQNREKPMYGAVIVSTFSFCTILVFYCLEYGLVVAKAYLSALLSCIISGAVVVFLYQFCYDKIAGKKHARLEQIIDEQYPLAEMMKAYSASDYEHARRVSKLAAECAALVGADAAIARAGGLYYRIGLLEGEPYIENGVNVAIDHNFPPEIARILSEYNGEKEMPSTLESAIIHIADNMITRFELIDQATLTSSWNQDIVVYQTLNDHSAQGLYDRAGLSMNMFLKIRDYLLKEAELI